MNRYSRVFHHISLDDVKRNKIKTEQKQKDFFKSIREARNFLRDLNSPYYSDWRSNPIEEGMNTGNTFQTTFPGTGESNLENIDANNADAYTAAGGQDALNGTSIKASGTGEGSDGGFNLGQSYLAFDGDTDSRHAILDPIDSSKFDTLVINAIVGNDSNGGEDPDVAGEELRLYYLEPGGSSFRSISVNPVGDQILPANADVLIDLGAGNGSLQQFSINLPSYARGVGFTYMLYQLTNSGAEFDHYGITNIKYQRRNPITLFVSLDSPEAVSFINDGSGGLSPAEKKKRLEDMLAASDEYMDTMFPTNQEAMRRAEQNLKRNIEISLDPDTFKFPEYQTPEYRDMFPSYIDDQSSTERIDRYLEQRGLTLDNLDKDFNSQKGTFTSLGQEGTLLLLNNPDTQERTLTAMGIDPGLVTNYTPDSWDKIRKITNLRPGGTPATGWDGKFYTFNDPQLEASQVIPLETYLQVKGTDNYIGVERPDRVEPGKRYVMEKEYSFSDPEPTYTGVRNKDIEERNDRTHYIASVGTDMYVGGHKWDYTLYTKDADLKGSKHMLSQLAGSAARSLNYINRNAEFLAFDFLRRYQSGENGSFYGDLYNQYKDTDIFNNYDPLWVWKSDPTMTSMLGLLRSISSGSRLMYPRSEYSSDRSYQSALSRNNRLVDDLQKALRLFDTPRTLSQYEKDEWYYKRDDDRVTEVRTTHPYSGLPEPGEEPQEPQEPQEPTEPETDGKLPEVQINAFSDGLTLKQLTIDDFEKAADFSAFKNGGGNAKLKQGYTLEQVIELGKKNIDGYDGGSPPRTAPVEYDTNNVISTLKSAANVISDNKELTSLLAIAGTIKAIGAGSLVLTTGAIASSSYAIAAVTAPEVTDARMYQTQLLAKLTGSIVSGKSAEVKIGDRGIQDMVSSINPNGFESAIQIGSAPKPNEQNAIKPTPFMKKDDVLTGSWNDIGAVEVHVNPRTKAVTITSNKMLRTGQPGDKFENALVSDGVVLSPGTQTKFGDIPVLSPDQIQQGLDRFNLRKPLENLFKTVQLVDKRPGDRMNSFANIASLMIDMAANGTASNAVQLRRFFTDRGAKKSEMEMQDAGYGHTFSQTEISFDKLPIEIRNIINNKLGKETLGGGSLGDVLQGTDATDAATVAADNKKKNKNNTNTQTEMYEPKAKHNEKITKHPKIKSPKEFFKRADIKPVYPDTPPPEMINGRHPDLVDGQKVSNRYNRLDPASAKAMPPTGNPHIDKKVRAAARKPK